MFFITEQQRAEAIRACDGIQEAIAKQQQALKNIIAICDRMANPTRLPRDGDSVEGDLTGSV